MLHSAYAVFFKKKENMEGIKFTLGGETPVVEVPCLQVGRILFRPLFVIDLSASAGLPHETGKIVPADVIADFFKPWDANPFGFARVAEGACRPCKRRRCRFSMITSPGFFFSNRGGLIHSNGGRKKELSSVNSYHFFIRGNGKIRVCSLSDDKGCGYSTALFFKMSQLQEGNMTMTRKTCITVAAAAALCFGIAFSAYAFGVGAAAEKAVTGVSESSAGQATAVAAKGVTDAAKDAAAEVITNAKDKAVGMAKEQANKAVDAATQKATEALTGTQKAAGAAADAVKGAAK